VPDPAAVGHQPRWSAAAAAALERAAARSGDRPGALALLAELAADPDSRAAQILRSAGVDPIVVRARCAQVRRLP
jgi:sirohydrochlorin ferrochelatase